MEPIEPPDETSQYDILLIEDEPDLNFLITKYFESKGITCKGVTTGTRGLEELEYHTPKLVLMCVLLPDYSGVDICKKIKSNQNLKHIPVFFCTVMEEEVVKSRLAETKADGYIQKPVSFSDLDRILDLLKSISVKEIQSTPLLEYKINEFLSLKLEGIFKLRTQIYVKGKKFLQCKWLFPLYDEIDLSSSEQEFWGHCSNLQAWYENDYDTRLLHSNLVFNLLKALVEAGDPIAKRVFKTEVVERFRSGDPKTIIVILDAKLLDYFSLEEKRELIRPNISIVLKYFPKLLDCFTPEDQRDIIQKNFHDLLIYIELVSNELFVVSLQIIFAIGGIITILGAFLYAKNVSFAIIFIIIGALVGGINIITIWAVRLVRNDINQMKTTQGLE